MADTHDYDTAEVLGKDLNDTHVLVGESGGLSAVYDNAASSVMVGLCAVQTEHGMLMLDPERAYDVIADATSGDDEHPPHVDCADGCGLAVTHDGACLDKPGGRQVCGAVNHQEVEVGSWAAMSPAQQAEHLVRDHGFDAGYFTDDKLNAIYADEDAVIAAFTASEVNADFAARSINHAVGTPDARLNWHSGDHDEYLGAPLRHTHTEEN